MRSILGPLGLLLGLASTTAPLHAQSTFVVAGPDASLSGAPDDLAFDGISMEPLRAALQNPAHFGPAGLVPTRIETRTLTQLEPQLEHVDCFFSGLWPEAQCSDEDVRLLVDWFLRGGSLILCQDDPTSDKIGAALGIPVSSSSSGEAVGLAPFFDGPFGEVGSVRADQLTPGRLSTLDIHRTRGHVAGNNTAGEVFVAFWNPGAYAPNAGSLVILGDHGSLSSLQASYAPLDDNGRFALNLFALVAQREAVYVLGGPDSSVTQSSGTRAWDGGVKIADYRAALEDPAYFGKDGIVPVRIITQDIADFSPHVLMGLDGFAYVYWKDSSVPTGAEDTLVSFFSVGGDLLLMDDHPGWDKVGDRLGVPTVGPNQDRVMNGVAPYFEGSFGTAVDVTQDTLPAMFVEADVLAAGGTVAARNSADEVLAALWHEGDFGVTSGNLALLSNSGIATNEYAQYHPLDDNGTFSLNVVEFLVTHRVRRIAGPSSALVGPLPLSWDGVALSPLRAALRDPAYFSSHAPGGARIQDESLDALQLIDLLRYDAFVVPAWKDVDLDSETAELLRLYHDYGGNLALFCESHEDDRMAELLGVPVFSPSSGSPSQGGAPLAEGPFGLASSVLQSSGGWLSSVLLDTVNGSAALSNVQGEITAAVWRPGQHAPGRGTLVLVPDADTISTATAQFAPLNDNGRFALNTFAFLLDARCAGEVAHYGQGCPGTGSITPTQRLEGCPETGSTVTLSFRNTRGGALGLLWLGHEGRSDLRFKDCPFLVGGRPWLIPLPMGGGTGIAGAGGLTLQRTLPDDPLLDGFRLNTQLYVLDSGVASGLAATDGLEFTIRDR